MNAAPGSVADGPVLEARGAGLRLSGLLNGSGMLSALLTSERAVLGGRVFAGLGSIGGRIDLDGFDDGIGSSGIEESIRIREGSSPVLTRPGRVDGLLVLACRKAVGDGPAIPIVLALLARGFTASRRSDMYREAAGMAVRTTGGFTL
jgi:hypothetical protein